MIFLFVVIKSKQMKTVRIIVRATGNLQVEKLQIYHILIAFFVKMNTQFK